MKHKIFISYSHKDKDKVDLIVKELKNHPTFEPLVIASNREAGKLLADKVIYGIKNAEIIIPIITERSISEQWINQEIGFATAINRTVMPIIDNGLINDLKGFIHKQIDLPYSYQRKSITGQENRNFIECFRLLLSDLEIAFNNKATIEKKTLPEKRTFKDSLTQFDKSLLELQYQETKKTFLNSQVGANAVKLELKDLFIDIHKKIDLLRERNIHFGIEQTEVLLIVKGEGYSFSVFLGTLHRVGGIKYELTIKFWQGMLALDPYRTPYFPGREPKLIENITYYFDRNRNGEVCWTNTSDNKEYSSSEISNNNFKWLLDKVAEKRLKSI